jgi:hypothetical protein
LNNNCDIIAIKKIDGFQGTFISANGSSRDYIILEELTALKGDRTLEAMVNEPVPRCD